MNSKQRRTWKRLTPSKRAKKRPTKYYKPESPSGNRAYAKYDQKKPARRRFLGIF
jgi:hypothetical protein